MSQQKYSREQREKILKLHLQEGRSVNSLTAEYHLGKGTLSYWVKEYRKECQENPTTKEQAESFERVQRMEKELAELKKENEFLKKAAAFFAKETK